MSETDYLTCKSLSLCLWGNQCYLSVPQVLGDLLSYFLHKTDMQWRPKQDPLLSHLICSANRERQEPEEKQDWEKPLDLVNG